MRRESQDRRRAPSVLVGPFRIDDVDEGFTLIPISIPAFLTIKGSTIDVGPSESVEFICRKVKGQQQRVRGRKTIQVSDMSKDIREWTVCSELSSDRTLDVTSQSNAP